MGTIARAASRPGVADRFETESAEAFPEGLTVLLPCYNEADRVERAHAAVREALRELPDVEILVVDDGSVDATLDRVRALAARDSGLRYVSFTRNFGLEAAFAAGFQYASKPWIVQLDADLQSPPEEILRLLEAAAGGNYDVVFGVRTNRQDSLLRRVGASAQQWIARRLLRIELPPGASSFRLVRTAVARTIADVQFGSPYFIAIVPLVGARYTCVPTRHQARSGTSRFRFWRLVGHSFELFFGYSWRPLNVVYLVAALGTASALVVTGLAVFGAASAELLAAVAVATSALGLGCLALVGRYLHRLLLDERRLRPYYVREANVVVRPEDTLDGGSQTPAPFHEAAPARALDETVAV